MLRALRREDRREFTSRARVTRPDTAADPVWSDAENDYVTPDLIVYEGRCQLVATEQEARVVQAGDRAVSLRTYTFRALHDVTFANSDTVEMISSRDPLAVGLELRVIDLPKSDFVTTREVVLEEKV